MLLLEAMLNLYSFFVDFFVLFHVNLSCIFLRFWIIMNASCKIARICTYKIARFCTETIASGNHNYNRTKFATRSRTNINMEILKFIIKLYWMYDKFLDTINFDHLYPSIYKLQLLGTSVRPYWLMNICEQKVRWFARSTNNIYHCIPLTQRSILFVFRSLI